MEEKNTISSKNEKGTTESQTFTTENLPNPTRFTYQNHKFEIVYYYQNYLDYIEKAEKQSDDVDDLYLELVINPLTDGDGEWLSKEWGFSRPTRLQLLKKQLTSLMKNHNTIDQRIVDTLKKSADKLTPGINKTIYVLPANPDNTKGMKKVKGVSGTTWSSDFITMQIAPSILEKNILKFTMAHEYHHSVLFEHSQPELHPTLLESTLIEGKADSFARMVYPDITPPWSDFSTKENEEISRDFFTKNKDSNDPSILNDFFYGNSSKGLPEWATYKMGNTIMEQFNNVNSNLSVTEWTNMTAEEILQKSNYSNK